MKITKNLATADRIVRLVVFVLVAVLFVTKLIGGPMAAVLIAVSAALGLTALAGFCPVRRWINPRHHKDGRVI